MSTLIDGLYLAQRALYAQQVGLDVTQQNIANVNTPNYTRQRVDFVPGNPPAGLEPNAGTGVAAIAVDSFRNRFLDFRVNRELQGQGEQDALMLALQQVDALLNDGGDHGLESALSDFFNSFSSLANAPEDPSRRQDVLSRAQVLVQEFGRVYDKIQSVQMSEDRAVDDTVKEINNLTSAIAELNVKVGQLSGTHSQDESIFRDQRQSLLDELSKLVDISYFETEGGAFTVTTRQGGLLVVGDQSNQMQAAASGGLLQVELQGANITATIESGKLGGLLEARDPLLSSYLTSLDDMAATLIGQVNAQHAAGTDYNGNNGGNFFTPFVQTVPGSNVGAARSMSLAITDPKLVAAAGPGGGPGDNANALLLSGIRDRQVFVAGTANQTFADLVYRIGSDYRDAGDRLEIQKQVLSQLENQRDAFSGVNLDEEAIDIVRYQKAYQTSARYIQTVNTLTDDVLNILGV